MLIFVAIVIWILINYFTWWLDFYSILCICAGIFVIMPSLLKFNFSDLKIIFKHKMLFFINLVFNFVILPAIFVGIWYLFGLSDVILYALFLLWILPWGWLLMSWVLKTNWSSKLAFSFFLFNLIVFTFLFFPMNSYFEEKWNQIIENQNINSEQWYFWTAVNNDFSCIISTISPDSVSCFSDSWWASPFTAILVLIIIPFIISRFVLLSKTVTKVIQSKIRLISSISTFFIIWYIFSLKQINSIFLIDLWLLLNVWLSIFISYVLIYLLWFLVYKISWSDINSNSVFWNITVRFITLWLIFSFIYSTVFWIWFTVVFVLAYFIQILLSTIFWKIIWDKKLD